MAWQQWGGHKSQKEARNIDATLTNKAAWKVVGPKMAMRTEMLMALAGVKRTKNCYILQTANINDRTL